MAEFDYLYDVTSNNSDYQSDRKSNKKTDKKVLIDFTNQKGQTSLTTKETLFAQEPQYAAPLKLMTPKYDFSLTKFAPQTKLVGFDTTKFITPQDSTKQVKADAIPVSIPKVGNETKPFAENTQSLMYKIPHKTKLLNVAQDHLGIQEVTEKEYKKLPAMERKNTQKHMIEGFGKLDEAWCAHTVSHLCTEAGIPIDGHKKLVKEFIDWAKSKDYYRPIETTEMTPENYKTERNHRESEINLQLKNMKEGDLIIWKSDTTFTSQLGLKHHKASHIGVIEGVDNSGNVSVIEGNANEFKKGNGVEHLIVTNKAEAKIGNQGIGASQEVNNRDGVIRKIYTAKELAANGYSGYIDMQKIVK